MLVCIVIGTIPCMEIYLTGPYGPVYVKQLALHGIDYIQCRLPT